MPDNVGDIVDCSAFPTQDDAQAWFDTYNPHHGDIALLDPDLNGRACDEPPPPVVPDNVGDIVDCSDFPTQDDAQAWFDTYNPHHGDIALLDPDLNGRACD